MRPGRVGGGDSDGDGCMDRGRLSGPASSSESEEVAEEVLQDCGES